MQSLQSNNPEINGLSALIVLLEMEYPDEDLDNIETLRKLLKEEFNLDYSKEDIIAHYMIHVEAEDIRLQHKHLNIRI